MLHYRCHKATCAIVSLCQTILSGVSVAPCSFSEEIPNEENEINNDSLSKSSAEAKPEGSPTLPHKKAVPNSGLPATANHDSAIAVSPALAVPTGNKERLRTPELNLLPSPAV